MVLSSKEVEEFKRWVQKNPRRHLVKCSPEQLIERRNAEQFPGFNSSIIKLTYNVALIEKKGQFYNILIISEMSQGNKKPLYNWAIIDDKGNFIALRQHKTSTLPGQFVERQDLYDQLSGFTYCWKRDNNDILNVNEEYFFKGEGEPWIEYPHVNGLSANLKTQRSARKSL